MSEQHKTPKKYYEYYYTWSMAEAMRKKHRRNGRRVSVKVGLTKADTKKKWVIWYNRERDNSIIPADTRYYDK